MLVGAFLIEHKCEMLISLVRVGVEANEGRRRREEGGEEEEQEDQA